MEKFEQLIEFIINDEEEKAKELFHDVVVEKSRDIYEQLMAEDEAKAEADAKEVAESNGFLQQSDEGAMEAIAQQVIDENPDAVESYKAGKEASIKFMMGQGMKISKGSANPQVLEEVIKKLIG